MNMQSLVALVKSSTNDYPDKETLFRPSQCYPELKALGFDICISSNNPVYEAVREGFHLMKFDEENYGTEKWNPLGNIIKPGDYVLIKPNLVMDINQNIAEGQKCLYTQPSVVAPVIDYVIIALEGKGRIVVGDAPMQECKFQRLVAESGYEEMVNYYKSHGVDIELVDFRELTSEVRNGMRYNSINKHSQGRIVNLDEESEFASFSENETKKFRVPNYDCRIMKQHHNETIHEYYVSQYVLDADVIINMPKPKSHRKAGATISLKNYVGINTRKEYLPHHRIGGGKHGDEYQNNSIVHRFRSWILDRKNICEAENRHSFAMIYRCINKICSLWLSNIEQAQYYDGSWWGNDTISRTTLDLNKIVLYADKEGCMNDAPIRKTLVVADMIIAGHKEGPVAPSSKEVGYIAVGVNNVCFDEAVSAFMGFDCSKIPSIRRARSIYGKYKIVDGSAPLIVSNVQQLNNLNPGSIPNEFMQNFEPTSGWKGHIELY